jgi:hypothetical protein
VETLLHLARWFAWQLREADPPHEPASARITIFSSSSPYPSGEDAAA